MVTNHLDCNFGCYDFAKLNHCREKLKNFHVSSCFILLLVDFLNWDYARNICLYRTKDNLNLMKSEGQSSRMALAVFLKITLNPISIWMSTSCNHLVSYFPSCLLTFAMNRNGGNKGNQFIVPELKTARQYHILKMPHF